MTPMCSAPSTALSNRRATVRMPGVLAPRAELVSKQAAFDALLDHLDFDALRALLDQ
jgi:hypothetical protein